MYGTCSHSPWFLFYFTYFFLLWIFLLLLLLLLLVLLFVLFSVLKLSCYQTCVLFAVNSQCICWYFFFFVFVSFIHFIYVFQFRKRIIRPLNFNWNGRGFDLISDIAYVFFNIFFILSFFLDTYFTSLLQRKIKKKQNKKRFFCIWLLKPDNGDSYEESDMHTYISIMITVSKN